MSYKPFSKSLYDSCDTESKRLASLFLQQFGFEQETPLSEQKEVFKEYDFIIHQNGKEVEVEKKKVWKARGKWQGFSTIDIPGRKSESKAKLFVMFNNHLDTLAVAKMKDILSAPTTTKDTIYTYDEEFYNVSLDKFKFYYLQNNEWVEFM